MDGMCGIEKPGEKGTKAQGVVVRGSWKHYGLLKRGSPGRVYRRKHGVNSGDSGRSRTIFLKITIDKK
jgi:hypothetical protein